MYRNDPFFWLGLAICLGMPLLPLLGSVWLFLTLAGEDYRSLRRVFRERRFGLLSIFIITAIVAVAFGVLRANGTDYADPSAVCFGLFGLGVGIVVVGLVWLMFSDRLERHESRRLRTKVFAPDVRISPPSMVGEIPLAELADEELGPHPTKPEPEMPS